MPEDRSAYLIYKYPGETNTWSFDIENSAPVVYSIAANLTYSAPSGITITDFTVRGIDETSDLTEDDSAEFSILPKETISCSMTISAAKDATPGTVSVSLDLSRE